MKHIRWAVRAAAMWLLLLSPAMAQEEDAEPVGEPEPVGEREPATRPHQAKERKAKPPRRGADKDLAGKEGLGPDVTSMAEELKLTEQQLKKIQEVLNERDEAIRKHEEAAAKQRERLTAAMERARTKSQKNQVKAALDRIDKAETKALIEAKFAHKAMISLTPAQRGQWNAAKLQEAVLKEFEALTLTPEQQEKVKTLCKQAGERIAQPVDVRFVPALKNSAVAQVFRTILTPEQRKQYAESKAPKKHADKKDKPSDRKRAGRGRKRS